MANLGMILLMGGGLVLLAGESLSALLESGVLVLGWYDLGVLKIYETLLLNF
jgi:hypothetical protein